MLVKMASPQTPPPKREGLINLSAKSPSLLGEGDCLRRARPDKSGLGLGGEAEIRQEKRKSYIVVRKAMS
jgi:hypothetical protein